MRIPFILFFVMFAFCATAQTSYTWNGSSSTDWSNTSNWTPSGTPGTGDNVTVGGGTNILTLTANITVNNLTMNSGTLRLGGYVLTSTGQVQLLGGTVENGRFVHNSATQTATFYNTTLDCKVQTTGKVASMNASKFKDSLSMSITQGFNGGGNKFYDYTAMAFSGSGQETAFGLYNPDTFFAPVKFSVLSYHNLTLAYYSYGSYFADTVYLNNVSGIGTVIKVGHVSCGSTFAGDIVVNTLAGAGNIHFAVGVHHDGRIRIGSQGFLTGRLILAGYTQLDNHLIDLDGMHANSTAVFGPNLSVIGPVHSTTAEAEILSNCVFNEAVEISGLNVWTGAKFKDVAHLESCAHTGGNVFEDSLFVTGGGFALGYPTPDTCLGPASFSLTTAGNLQIACSVGNYFADHVTINHNTGHTGNFVYVGSASITSSSRFDSDIALNVASGGGGIIFDQSTVVHNGMLRLGENGFLSGVLQLKKYKQTVTDTLNFSGMHSSTSVTVSHASDIAAHLVRTAGPSITLTNSIIRGTTHIVAPRISTITNRFIGTTYLEKTGATTDANYGNGFYGAATIVNNSSTNANLQFSWLLSTPDTFYSHLTLANYTTSVLHSTGIYKGNLTFVGDSAAQFQLAHGNTLRSVLNGTTDQALTVAPNLNVQFFGLDVNKPTGKVTLSGTVDVQEDLAMQKGIVNSANANLLLRDNATVTGASDSSYVDGPVLKVGDDAFTFPVGDAGKYRPLAMAAPNTNTAQYLVEHVHKNPNRKLGMNIIDTTIKYITPINYWVVDRLLSSSNVKWTVPWHVSDNYIFFDPDSALVVGWDGLGWENLGNEAVTGDSTLGTVRSSTTIDPTTYSAISLGSESARVLPKSLSGTAALSASETDTTDVTVTLVPSFGFGDVSLVWNRTSFPKESYIDSLWDSSVELDSFFVAIDETLTVPDSIMQFMVGRKHSWVGSGLHEASMIDASGDTIVFDVPIADPVDFLTLSGVTYSNDSLTKTSVTSGWTTGYASLMGMADSLDNCAIKVTIADTTAVSALGVKLVSVADTGGYQHMTYAAVFDSTDVHIWYNDSLYQDVSRAALNDEFTVMFKRGEFSLTRNGVKMHAVVHGPMGKRNPGISLAHSGKTPFINIASFFPRPRVTVKVNHQSCNVTNSGSAEISLSISPSSYPYYSCTWHHTGGAELTEFSGQLAATGLAAGNYTFVFYPSPTAMPVVTYFRIDYWVDWTNLVEVSEYPNDESVAWVNPLSPSTSVAPIFNSGADSHNNLSSNGSGFVQFKLGQQGIAPTSGLRIHGFIGLSPTGAAADPGLNVEYAAVPISIVSSPSMNYFAMVKNGEFQTWAMAPASNPIGFYRFHSGNTIGFTHGNGAGITGVLMHEMTGISGGEWIIDASVIMGSFENAWTNFPCSGIPFGISPCAKLLREVDGGYHWVLDDKLTFVYEEEYLDNGDLKYRVLNRDNVEVISNTGVVPNTINDGGLKYYGDNRYQISLASVIDNGMYILEVTSAKAEKFYLRFKKGI